jgi:hypothetical protein
MENVALAIALIAWFALTVWLYCSLIGASRQVRSLTFDFNSEHSYALKLRDEILRMRAQAIAQPSPLPEIYTPEQFDARQKQRDEASGQKRRWHEQQKDVSKALKWDDAAKGEQ